METATLVRILGGGACLLGILLCAHLARTRWSEFPQAKSVSLGIASLSSIAFHKLLAFVALAAVPAGAVFIAHYHTFQGVHEVGGCGACHVMRPMINDLRDPKSVTLAARHYRNRWIAATQCYECHSDYGLAGDLAAKAEGYRHLARYTSWTYQEPIHSRARFNNQNCLKCHRGTQKFESATSHRTVQSLLEASEMSCLNCHGQAHPSRADRTPGSAAYLRLTEVR